MQIQLSKISALCLGRTEAKVLIIILNIFNFYNNVLKKAEWDIGGKGLSPSWIVMMVCFHLGLWQEEISPFHSVFSGLSSRRLNQHCPDCRTKLSLLEGFSLKTHWNRAYSFHRQIIPNLNWCQFLNIYLPWLSSMTSLSFPRDIGKK